MDNKDALLQLPEKVIAYIIEEEISWEEVQHLLNQFGKKKILKIVTLYIETRQKFTRVQVDVVKFALLYEHELISLLGKIEESYDLLQKAQELGYENTELIQELQQQLNDAVNKINAMNDSSALGEVEELITKVYDRLNSRKNGIKDFV